MASKLAAIAVFLFISVSCINALQTVNGKIKISVVTTSGCGDTINFIGSQLAEAYQTYGEFLEIEIIPWGRTIRNPDNSLTCQFGVADCWANRLHRCALDLLKGNQDAQMFYINCEFTSPYPSYLQNSYLCAQAVGLSLVDVDYCVNTSGAVLDAASEVLAREPMSIINFVPSIYFNDEIDIDLHTEARTRLTNLICFALAEDSSTGVTNCQVTN